MNKLDERVMPDVKKTIDRIVKNLMLTAYSSCDKDNSTDVLHNYIAERGAHYSDKYGNMTEVDLMFELLVNLGDNMNRIDL